MMNLGLPPCPQLKKADQHPADQHWPHHAESGLKLSNREETPKRQVLPASQGHAPLSIGLKTLTVPTACGKISQNLTSTLVIKMMTCNYFRFRELIF